MPRLPFIIVTGFLGSGKTTLINAYLRRRPEEHALVMVNELGDVSVDHALITTTSGQIIIPLAGGCLCCAYRGELAPRLKQALREAQPSTPRLRRLIIETSGLASPVSVEQELMCDPELSTILRVGGILACLDVTASPWSESVRPVALEQLAIADQILLTKADLAPGRLAAMRKFAANVNPHAALFEQTRDILASELDDTSLLRMRRWSKSLGSFGTPLHPDIERMVFSPPALPLDKVYEQVARVCTVAGTRLLRAKGIIKPRPDGVCFALQAVGGLLYPPVSLPESVSCDPVLVLIGHTGLGHLVAPLLSDWAVPTSGKASARLPVGAVPQQTPSRKHTYGRTRQSLY